MRLAILMIPTVDADEGSLATRETSPDVMSCTLPLRITNKKRIVGYCWIPNNFAFWFQRPDRH
jgi:hypothetical protein